MKTIQTVTNVVAATLACWLTAGTAPAAAQGNDVTVSHGLDLFGGLQYPPDFKNFGYVNPDAPKGGSVVLSTQGTFDNLNPYIVKGTAANGLSVLGSNLVTDSLMYHNDGEPADRKSTRLNSSHVALSRMPSSA